MTDEDTAEHFTAELLKRKAADLSIGEHELSERFVNPTLTGEWPRGRDLDYEPAHKGPEPDEVGYEGKR